MEQHVDLPGFDAGNRLFLADQPFFDHVDGDLDGGSGGALPVAGLEHPQFAVLDCEFHVLHFTVVVLQQLGDFHHSLVNLRGPFFKIGDLQRRARAGYHVLALSVEQVLAEQFDLASGGIAGEGDAGAAVIADVAKDHRHDVDRRAEVVGNAGSIAIVNGRCAVPGFKYGGDGKLKLLPGVLREFSAGFFYDQVLELLDNRLPPLGGDFRVALDALFCPDLLDVVFELQTFDVEDDLAEHLHQAAVRVPGKAVTGFGGQRFDRLVVQAQVEDGVHHTGHRNTRTGANRNQERVTVIAELASHLLAEMFHPLDGLFPHAFGELFARIEIGETGFSRNRVAWWNRQTDTGHFAQVSALTAKKVPHRCIAFFEGIYPLFSHILKLLSLEGSTLSLSHRI